MKTWLIILVVLFTFLISCTIGTQKMINTETTDVGNRKNIFGIIDKNDNWFEFSGAGAVLSGGAVRGHLTNTSKKEIIVEIPIKDIKRIFVRTTAISDGLLNIISGLGFVTYGIALPFSAAAILPALLISGAATLF